MIDQRINLAARSATDADDLQAAIATALPGSQVTLAPGDYAIRQGLLLVGKQRLRVRGAGRGITRLVVTDQLLTQNGFPNTLNATCGVISIYSCTDILLEGFDIVGPEAWHYVGGLGSTGSTSRNPAVNSLNYKGIAIRDNNTDIVVRDVGIRNILDEALYFDAVVGNQSERAERLRFERLDIRDCGHDGIAINNPWTYTVDIIDCTIENVGGNCIEGSCENLTIEGCHLSLPNPSNDFLMSIYAFRGRTIVANNHFYTSDLTLGGGGAIQIGWQDDFGSQHPYSVVVANNSIASIKTKTTDATNPGAAIDIVDARGPVSITGNIVTGCGLVNGSDPPAAAIHIRGASTYAVYIAGNSLVRGLNGLAHPASPGAGNQEVGIRIAADVPVDNAIVIGDNLILANTPTDFAVEPLRKAAA